MLLQLFWYSCKVKLLNNCASCLNGKFLNFTSPLSFQPLCFVNEHVSGVIHLALTQPQSSWWTSGARTRTEDIKSYQLSGNFRHHQSWSHFGPPPLAVLWGLWSSLMGRFQSEVLGHSWAFSTGWPIRGFLGIQSTSTGISLGTVHHKQRKKQLKISFQEKKKFRAKVVSKEPGGKIPWCEN